MMNILPVRILYLGALHVVLSVPNDSAVKRPKSNQASVGRDEELQGQGSPIKTLFGCFWDIRGRQLSIFFGRGRRRPKEA